MRDRDSTFVRRAARLLAALVLTGCAQAPPQALGTLEYDRIVLPSPAAERIVAVTVREGERVRAGQVLLRLEATRTLAATEAARSQVRRQRAALTELEVGPASKPSRNRALNWRPRKRRRAMPRPTTPACSRWVAGNWSRPRTSTAPAPHAGNAQAQVQAARAPWRTRARHAPRTDRAGRGCVAARSRWS